MTNQFNLDKIKILLKKFPESRPFICEGLPIKNECIFIVGYNAATKLKRKFKKDWNDTKGFDYKNWIKYYEKERNKKGKRNRLSNTRLRLEWITSKLSPMQTIETNIYNIPTANIKELTDKEKNSEIFEILIEELNPKIIILHAKDSLKIFNKIYDKNIKQGKFENIQIKEGIQIKVKAVNHFSRGWSKDSIYELTDEINAQLQQ